MLIIVKQQNVGYKDIRITMIAQAIKNLCSQYYDTLGLTAVQINSGNCMNFANDLENLGFSKAIWGIDTPDYLWSNIINLLNCETFAFKYNHCFIQYNNKFYDSECPQGVDYPYGLPFYKRKRLLVTLINIVCDITGDNKDEWAQIANYNWITEGCVYV